MMDRDDSDSSSLPIYLFGVFFIVEKQDSQGKMFLYRFLLLFSGL